MWPAGPERLETVDLFPEAACRAPGINPRIFYPRQGDNRASEAAKKVCAGCAHQIDCLEAGLGEQFGIWGGLTERDRRVERRLRRRLAVTDTPRLEQSTNGHGPELELEAPAQQLDHLTGAPARPCVVCKGPVPDGRRSTCSSECAQRRDRRRTPRTTGAGTGMSHLLADPGGALDPGPAAAGEISRNQVLGCSTLSTTEPAPASSAPLDLELGEDQPRRSALQDSHYPAPAPDLAAAVAALVVALGPLEGIDRLTLETGGRVLIVTRS